MPDLGQMTDEALDAHRREVLAEQERRQKLADGQARIGATVRDYFTAARLELPDLDDDQLGGQVIQAVAE